MSNKITMEFLIVNGKLAGKDEINLNHILTESTFRLSQKVWYGYGGIPLFTENVEQIKNQAEALRLPFPGEFENRRELFRLTKRMLNKNKFYRSGYIHFQLFWNKNQVQTLITANAFEIFDFPHNQAGLLVTISSQKKYTQNKYNRFPFFNETLWESGMGEIRQTPFQQVIFMNERNAICEGLRANIFLVKENVLLTPALSTGCYEDVLRSFILEAAGKLELNISENNQVSKRDILESNELFLASETSGIQWILGIENKRFLHYYSKKIHEIFIGELKPK
jgi:branched-subunit amino acid aminotransferase/4-amino-4-deoxychorismate lyase